MTKKEFKRAMQCGLGRCVQELHNTDDLEKYREIINCPLMLSAKGQEHGIYTVWFNAMQIRLPLLKRRYLVERSR